MNFSSTEKKFLPKMMLLGADQKPNKEKVKRFLQEINGSLDLTRRDITAMEEKIIKNRANEDNRHIKKSRLIEHLRIQHLLDTGVINVSDLMKQEVKDFIVLRKVKGDKVVPLSRCPSPSPVLSTPMFKKKKSIFLTRDFFDNLFKKDDIRKDDDDEAKEEATNEMTFNNEALEEMSYATKVDQLYSLAEKLIYVTDEGCKDVAAKLKF